MLVNRLPFYLKGYVLFAISGNNIESFINNSKRAGVSFFELRKKGDVYFAKCTVNDYKKFRKIKLNGIRRKIIKKSGLRFLLNRYRRRFGLILGFLTMVCILIILSQFVWSIDITGNDKISTNVIMQSLNEHGFKVGANKNKINIENIENMVLSDLFDIKWITINIDGSSAHIEMREKDLAPQTEDFKIPSNLIANRDGQIVKMEIVKGKPIATVGSGVVKGELLVAGEYLDKKENYILEHSSGKITARVYVDKEFSVDIKKVENIEKAKKIVDLELNHFEQKEFNDGVIEEKNIEEFSENNMYIVRVSYVALLDIAEQQNINVSNY